jgi:hypothetical protein
MSQVRKEFIVIGADPMPMDMLWRDAYFSLWQHLCLFNWALPFAPGPLPGSSASDDVVNEQRNLASNHVSEAVRGARCDAREPSTLNSRDDGFDEDGNVPVPLRAKFNFHVLAEDCGHDACETVTPDAAVTRVNSPVIVSRKAKDLAQSKSRSSCQLEDFEDVLSERALLLSRHSAGSDHVNTMPLDDDDDAGENGSDDD